MRRFVRHLLDDSTAAESGKSLSDFSKALKLLSECESGTLKQALSDTADRAEELSAIQQKQVPSLIGFDNCKCLSLKFTYLRI